MGKRDNILLSGVFIFGLVASAVGLRAECAPGVVELRGDWGAARFHVELADDDAERARGLMHRESLAAGRGMLFVYDRPQRTSFWMRNTLIPLDIIFADAEGVVTRVHENAVPLDETPIPGGDAVQSVLEINGGLSRKIGIGPGTELRHAALPQDGSAWSCDAEAN
ncbi:hypothetical protein LX81_03127 [Palleronia aestuarii]|uniref:DUF192 domain-containing protein n=1 Tax=Palleronia aestuarii TaxID=568105 RepID=A0A2W7NR74_9RHOB|nr:DUF192 domain-containing protein [Palleronia aestuarii]PZX13792.1 hypothetical protein LX81_03127 [Palleronia aestuarii]